MKYRFTHSLTLTHTYTHLPTALHSSVSEIANKKANQFIFIAKSVYSYLLRINKSDLHYNARDDELI